MTNYAEWWEGLTTSLKIYWGLAIPFTLLFLLQMIWSFFGDADVPDDTPDAEVTGDSGIEFQFFTIKNLIVFFTIFAWTGIASIDSGLSELMTVILAVAAGLVTMALMATLMYFMAKANTDGTMKIAKAVGETGQVYMPIGKQRKGVGQVQIKVQGALRTLDALTDDDDDIPTGNMIRVKSIINNSILLVTAQ
jgi:membrane protein implicated in regulation of membrane protease activity